MPKKSTQNLSFEEALRRLESIVEDMESGEISLEEAMESFEEGTSLIQLCTKKLNDAEIRLKQLTKDDDGEIKLDSLAQ